MTTDRHELKLIHGGKTMPYLGLPCDSCNRRLKAPGECGDCFFLAVRHRAIAGWLKAEEDRRTVKKKALRGPPRRSGPSSGETWSS